MEMDLAFFAAAVPAVLFAAVSKGGFGSGAALAATPILALVMDPAQAVGLMLPLLMLMDVASLKAYWRKWSWLHARRLMTGSLGGIAAGALLFRQVSPDGIRLMVGSIAVGFVAFQAARARGYLVPSARRETSRSGYVWGCVAGFTSFFSHAGGPPASMYLLTCGLTKTQYQATTVVVFWWINLVKFGPYLALGMFNLETAAAGLYLAPLAVLGVVLGAWAHRIVSERWYFRFTYALLLVTGSKLIFDALF